VPDFRLKFTQFDYGWGSAPVPFGELSSLPGFRGHTSKGREGREGEWKGTMGRGLNQALIRSPYFLLQICALLVVDMCLAYLALVIKNYIEKLHTVYPMLYKPTLKNSKN